MDHPFFRTLKWFRSGPSVSASFLGLVAVPNGLDSRVCAAGNVSSSAAFHLASICNPKALLKTNLSDPKVSLQTIPFAFSKEDAINHIGFSASYAQLGTYKGRMHVLEQYGDLRFGKALYYPTWFIDVTLQVKALFPSESSKDSVAEVATVRVKQAYIPGSGMDLGRVLVRDRSVNHKLARPFSDDLARQHGFDVTCLPYDIAPFDLLRTAQNLSSSQAVFKENFGFRPDSLKLCFAVAFPVLRPVYIAQYFTREPWPPLTVVLPAHRKPGPHYVHVARDNEDRPRLLIEELVSHDYIACDGAPEHANILINMFCAETCYEIRDSWTRALSSWLNDKLDARNSPLSMATAQPVDMDDLRAFSAAPISELAPKLRATVPLFKKLDVDEFKKEHAEITPDWWRQWEQSQTPKK
ncbi:hypothetical protein BU15DRAFT_75869 [Melanogaster broomeanus]|nr:hypothetical protein BU15DRAFT_75869 [Melanogaster broomeanus]